MDVFQHRVWLGHGSYGDVQLCEVSPQTAKLLGIDPERAQQPSGPVLIALKTWKQAHKDGKVMRIALREVQILNAVNHPNIIRLQCAFRTPSGRVCMAFEYGGKSTHQLLESRFPRGIPQPLLKRFAFQLIQALRYLHSQQIIHRDVKPANVLVDAAGVLRLCDFGFARYTAAAAAPAAAARGGGGGGDMMGGEPLTPYIITRWYRAPEVLLGMPYGTPTDVWSLGCTLAELATGDPLLPGTTSLDQLGRIAALLGPMPTHMTARAEAPAAAAAPPPPPPLAPTDALRRHLESRLDPELLDLVEACLRTDPRDRPTMDELLNMPYFDDVARLFEGMSPLGQLYGVSAARHGGESTAPAWMPAPPPQAPPAQCRRHHHRCLQRSQRHQHPQPQPQPHAAPQQQQHHHHHQQLQHAIAAYHHPDMRHCHRQQHHHQQQQQQQQQPHEPSASNVFRHSGGRLPYSDRTSSSADVSAAASAAASVSYSTLSASTTSASVFSRSNTSGTDSMYGSTAALRCSCASAANCCSCARQADGGGSDDGGAGDGGLPSAPTPAVTASPASQGVAGAARSAAGAGGLGSDPERSDEAGLAPHHEPAAASGPASPPPLSTHSWQQQQQQQLQQQRHRGSGGVARASAHVRIADVRVVNCVLRDMAVDVTGVGGAIGSGSSSGTSSSRSSSGGGDSFETRQPVRRPRALMPERGAANPVVEPHAAAPAPPGAAAAPARAASAASPHQPRWRLAARVPLDKQDDDEQDDDDKQDDDEQDDDEQDDDDKQGEQVNAVATGSAMHGGDVGDVGDGGLAGCSQAAPALPSHWLEAYYHECPSPPVSSGLAAAAAAPVAAAAAAACIPFTTTTTTMSFNWHSAESPCVQQEESTWRGLMAAGMWAQPQQQQRPAVGPAVDWVGGSPSPTPHQHQTQKGARQLRAQRQQGLEEGEVAGELTLVSAGLWPPDATAQLTPARGAAAAGEEEEEGDSPSAAAAGAAARRALNASAAAAAAADTHLCGISGGDEPDGSGSSSSSSLDSGSEGCRPADLPWNRAALRKGFVSAPGCGGGGGLSGGGGDAAAAALGTPANPWARAPAATRSVAAASESRASVTCTLDPVSGLWACRGGGGGSTGSDGSGVATSGRGGGGRRAEGWFRRSRSWLKRVFEGGSVRSQRQL